MAKASYSDINGVARKNKKIYVGADNFARRNLPSGYTQVEYIQSSGTQYINTEFNPKYNSRIVIDASGLGTTQWLFGTRDSTSATATKQFCMYRTASAVRADYFGTKSGASTSLNVSDTTARMIYDMNANVLTFGGKTITNTAVSSGTCSRPLYLLTLNNVGTAHANGAKVKLYSCKIYDGATLVRDFVPCTNPSGTIGLYDLVGAQFYANEGTGIFTTGAVYASGVARSVKRGYVGVNGVARKWFPYFPIIQFRTGDGSNGNATVQELQSYQADNGNFIMKVKCRNATWSDLRAYALVNIIDEFIEGDTIIIKWNTGSTSTQYDDKKLKIFDENGNVLVDINTHGTVLSTSSSGTYTTTVPKNAYRIQVELSLGAQGNRDTTWTVTQLTVGNKTYTVKGD